MESTTRPVPANISSELLAELGKGDQRALETLYDHSSTILFTLALRILGDREQAAALLQEVYLDLWRKAARYDPRRGSPMTWLITLTRGRALDRLRSRAAAPGLGGATLPSSTAAATDDAPGFQTLADLELSAMVTRAFAGLPAAQQQVLELAYYEGRSQSEIARALNEPITTIRSRIISGMHSLKAAFSALAI